MFSKPVRFGLLIVGLLITAALTYRVVDDEASLGRGYRQADAHSRAATQAFEALLDLRASLHAYVAPGQGLPFWSRRSQDAIGIVREQLATLETALTPLDRSVADALAGVDKLAVAERRAREHARRGETLLAADVVFNEAREVFSSAIEQVHEARQSIDATRDRQASELRSEQSMLAAAAVGMWALIAALLAIPTPPLPGKKPEEWRHELATAIKKTIPKDPGQPAPVAAPVAPPAPAAPPAPVAPVEPGLPVTAITTVAEICADLSTLSEVGALSGALERAADVLEASGMIVWLASNDGTSLAPVASHGFDEKLVARIGRIPCDSANLTAAAYRDNGSRVSAATSDAPAALAVAMCGPSGTVGVLSVELKPGLAAEEGRVALATIMAAQLATLAGPLPSAVPMESQAPTAPRAARSAAL
jgi:hypothetical protein